MSDLVWGLQMMGIGMGVVFGLLIALWGLLIAIGKLDTVKKKKPAPAASPVPEPVVRVESVEGLDPDTLAAVTVAVITHAETRRRAAAPEVRAARPGSQLFASRWLAVGRGHQTSPFGRR